MQCAIVDDLKTILKGSLETFYHNFDPSQRKFFSGFVVRQPVPAVQLLMVAQIIEDLKLLHPQSFLRSVKTHDLPNY